MIVSRTVREYEWMRIWRQASLSPNTHNSVVTQKVYSEVGNLLAERHRLLVAKVAALLDKALLVHDKVLQVSTMYD